jgi:hypothetical protein
MPGSNKHACLDTIQHYECFMAKATGDNVQKLFSSSLTRCPNKLECSHLIFLAKSNILSNYRSLIHLAVRFFNLLGSFVKKAARVKRSSLLGCPGFSLVNLFTVVIYFTLQKKQQLQPVRNRSNKTG